MAAPERAPEREPPPAGLPPDAVLYTGGRDARGRPHGRGSLWLRPADESDGDDDSSSSGCSSGSDTCRARGPHGPAGAAGAAPSRCLRYEGRFRAGLRHGLGALHFPRGGGCLRGTWAGDELRGLATWTFADGGSLRGTWRDGELRGPATETAPGGALRFEGDYAGGVREGPGRLIMADGGEVWGTWRGGVLEGEACLYIYPVIGQAEGCVAGGCLVGRWEDGRMLRAVYRKALPPLAPPADTASAGGRGSSTERRGAAGGGWRAVVDLLRGGRLSGWAASAPGEQVYAAEGQDDGGGGDRSCPPASSYLVPDPWEEERVFVKASCTEGAGEGLFARVAMPPGQVAAFYSGVRLSHAEVDARDWRLNDNTISLDEDTVIDVPLALSQLAAYRATLGHKANHGARRPNARYDAFEHPRFGRIKCVRAVASIGAGDEVTVSYGYDLHGEHGVPAWFRALHEVEARGGGGACRKQSSFSPQRGE